MYTVRNTIFFILSALVIGCHAAPKAGTLLIERSGPLVGLEVRIGTPESPARGKTPIVFYLKRKNPVNVAVSLYYSVDGGKKFRKATSAGSHDRFSLIPVDAYERKHEFLWDSAADGVGLFASFTNVVFRVSVFEFLTCHHGPTMSFAMTVPFAVDNGEPLSDRYFTEFEEPDLPAWLRPVPPHFFAAKWNSDMRLSDVEGRILVLYSIKLLREGKLNGFFECLLPLDAGKPFSVKLRTRLKQPPADGWFCLLGVTQSGGWKELRISAKPYDSDRIRLEWEDDKINFRYRDGGGNWVPGKIGTGGEDAILHTESLRAVIAGVVQGSEFDVELLSNGESWQVRLLDLSGKALVVTEPVKWSDTYDNGTSYRCWWGRDGGVISAFRVSYDRFRYVRGKPRR